MRRNNIYRARELARALRKWHGDPREVGEDTITDALADLRHLCDLRKLSFHELDRRAYGHYSEELRGNDDPNFVKKRRAERKS